MSEANGFVHLHLHSEYSLLDGACRIKEIPKAAKAAGHSAVALTDHGVMYGAAAFCKACEAEGVRPILGCEVYVAPASRFAKQYRVDSDPYHLVLLVKNEVGYRNLLELVSRGFTEGFYMKPRVDLELLSLYHEGLIALSACLGGAIPQAILKNDPAGAEAYAKQLQAIFGEDFYLELQDHNLPDQREVNLALLELSRRTAIPLVATNDVHYLEKADAEAQAVLMAIQTNRTLAEGRLAAFETDEFYYKSTEEMTALFADCPEAIANTVRIAEQCDFTIRKGELQIPTYIPPDGSTPKQYLRRLAEAGLRQKIERGEITATEAHPIEDYKLRMEYELLVIGSMGYDGYYLIVWDFVSYAKGQGIPVGPGRGSGAGSLVAYLIGITDVDAIRYDLLFERFLNPERISMPDFDIDFCYNRRSEVIRYVTEKYGSDHVSQIVAFTTMAARAVVRDVGRALGISYADVDAVLAFVPRHLNVTLGEAMERPELKQLSEEKESIRRLLAYSQKLEGMPRHVSVHAAGVVITKDPLATYLPLATSGDTVITQYDMDTVAELGLLKFDFLGLRYLTVCADAEAQIRRTDPTFALDAIPLDDPDTYAMLSHGQTDGVFQLESGGMKQTLSSLRPTSMEDIMVAIALYRPGPMDSIPKYIENRKQREKIPYPLEKLKDILDSTCGCIVYQEQVMQICRTVAGYSYGKADKVRRIMAKKKKAEMEKEREVFLAGAKRNFIDDGIANALFDEMSGFASYAFNKSHAAAYALIAYRTAYLKRHYPQAYFAALLTSVLGNAAKTAEYLAEAARSSLRILSPDINRSRETYQADGSDGIRFGILAVKNVGIKLAESICAAREERPFSSFDDLIDRLPSRDINRRALESLISVGMFDSLPQNRVELLNALDDILARRTADRRGQVEGQLDFFSMMGAEATEAKGYAYASFPDLSVKEKCTLEKEYTGVYFSGHPLDEYSHHIEALAPTDLVTLRRKVTEGEAAAVDRKRIQIAARIAAKAEKTTRAGEQMAILTVEDRFSEVEMPVFPRQYSEFRSLLTVDAVLLFTAEVAIKEDEDIKLLFSKAEELKTNDTFEGAKTQQASPQSTAKQVPPKAAPSAPKRLFLRVESEASPTFRRAAAMVSLFPGETEVSFYFADRKEYRHKAGRIAVTPFLLTCFADLLGSENVIYR